MVAHQRGKNEVTYSENKKKKFVGKRRKNQAKEQQKKSIRKLGTILMQLQMWYNIQVSQSVIQLQSNVDGNILLIVRA